MQQLLTDKDIKKKSTTNHKLMRFLLQTEKKNVR